MTDLNERLKLARANERKHTDSGERDEAAKWARYARWLVKRIEQKKDA